MVEGETAKIYTSLYLPDDTLIVPNIFNEKHVYFVLL